MSFCIDIHRSSDMAVANKKTRLQNQINKGDGAPQTFEVMRVKVAPWHIAGL